MQQHIHNSLFAIEPSKHGMVAYQVTCSAHHRSVLSEFVTTVVSLLHSFQIYIVSMIINLLSSSTEVIMQYS